MCLDQLHAIKVRYQTQQSIKEGLSFMAFHPAMLFKYYHKLLCLLPARQCNTDLHSAASKTEKDILCSHSDEYCCCRSWWGNSASLA